ncbi:hypothetical protein D3C71_2047150 [compost metagenome]
MKTIWFVPVTAKFTTLTVKTIEAVLPISSVARMVSVPEVTADAEGPSVTVSSSLIV